MLSSGKIFGLSEKIFGLSEKYTALGPPKNMGPTAPLVDRFKWKWKVTTQKTLTVHMQLLAKSGTCRLTMYHLLHDNCLLLR
jgi:hypothetical protein